MAMIWIPSEIEAWEPAQVLSSDAKTVTIRLKNGKEAKIPGVLNKFDSIGTGSLEEICDNLVNLESFSEGIILHHTKKRFSEDKIYTFVGSILIALNPYKNIDIYGLPVIDNIFNKTKQNEVVPPHVFSIGAAAVRNMRQDAKDQAVLISGESGAGKTEATKKILQFISTICGSTASRIGASIENQILDSNPLLESFGNAKTIRNNNSSRFGKYMEVNFDKKMNVKGCNIVAYLLEKSRVVKQGGGERNYHVFYMLLAGANKDMRKDFNLKQADQFYYLSQSGCIEVDRRSDHKEYDEMIFAMNSLAFDIVTQTQIFQCLAGILHLGNLTFTNSRDVEGGSKVTSPSDCRRVASLLGINPDGLEKALCFKANTINGESLMIPLLPEKAVDQRDTLAKYVYGKIFDYIVQKVNSSLFRGKPCNNIGVLDIFGFEVFKVNSFEQLCINYCNERLQTFFNEIIFEGEMKTYLEEGLPCDDISFQDNVGCVRLIDLKGAGIFAYLDEEITIPKGTDEKFVSKLNQIFDENAGTKSIYFGRNRRSPLDFTIRHFAGDVTYEATNFMEKNKDALAESLVSQMQASSISMLHTAEESSSSSAAGGSAKKKNSKQSLAAKFKADLDNLMVTLRSTVPHFIRCVKPNNEQVPNKFDANLALNQLKYSGLFEAIRIRKSGYAVRMPIEAFIKRYKVCVDHIPAEVKNDSSVYCAHLLTELTKILPADEATSAPAAGKRPPPPGASSAGAKPEQRTWVVGKTRVFIRSQQFKFKMDALRERLASRNAAIPLQTIIRGFLARRKFIALMGDKRLVLEQSRKREAEERKLMSLADASSKEYDLIFRNDMVLQKKLAQAKAERSRLEREKVAAIRNTAAIKVQRIFRGKYGRNKGRVTMCERMFELALTKKDEAMLRRAIVMPTLLKVTSKLIKIYQHNAKNLILEVLNESYISNQLEEAITIGSVEILKDAIRLAEDSNMAYLPLHRAAKAKLEHVQMLKSALASMHSILSKCVTVPKLLSKVDVLQNLVQEAAALGLAGEFHVQQAAFRISKIHNLITLRDKIRFAVEICSPSKMRASMMERSKLLRIYGNDLCQEEALAVEGMFRMLNYQQHMEILNPEDEESAELVHGSSDVLETRMDATSFNDVLHEIVNSQQEADEHNNNNNSADVFLPPFARCPLDEMRTAKTDSELNAAIHSFVRLVPDEAKRKFYLRIFKWVVAFATWRYPRAATTTHRQKDDPLSAASNSVLEQLQKSMAYMGEDGLIGEGSGNLNSSGGAGVSGGSPAKKATNSNTPKKKGALLIGTNTHSLSVKAHTGKDNKLASPAKGTAAAMTRSQLIQNQDATPSPQKGGTLSASKTAAAAPSSTGKGSSSAAFTSSSSYTTPVKGSRPNTAPSTAASGSSASKYGSTAAGLSASKESPTLGVTTSAIPFSQRQSKSQVAVHEILKKGKKHTYQQFHTKTDQLLEKSIGEYDKFVSTQLKPAPKF